LISFAVVIPSEGLFEEPESLKETQPPCVMQSQVQVSAFARVLKPSWSNHRTLLVLSPLAHSPCTERGGSRQLRGRRSRVRAGLGIANGSVRTELAEQNLQTGISQMSLNFNNFFNNPCLGSE